jgi:hypothetical protein
MAHKTSKQLEKILKDAGADKLATGDVYRHWKDAQKHYVIVSVGFSEGSETPSVTYRQVGQRFTWTRRLTGRKGWFTPERTRPGKDKSRFILVRRGDKNR